MAQTLIPKNLEDLLSVTLTTSDKLSPQDESHYQEELEKDIQTQSLEVLTEIGKYIEDNKKVNKYDEERVKYFSNYVNNQILLRLQIAKKYQTEYKIKDGAYSLTKFLEKKNIKNLYGSMKKLDEMRIKKKLYDGVDKKTASQPKDIQRLANIKHALGHLTTVTTRKDLLAKAFYKIKLFNLSANPSAFRDNTSFDSSFLKNSSPLRTTRSSIAAPPHRGRKLAHLAESGQKPVYARAIQIKYGLHHIKSLVLPRLYKAFRKISEAQASKAEKEHLKSKTKVALLRNLIKKRQIQQMQNTLSAFHTWKSKILSEPLKKTKITNRVKGRILISLSRPSSYLTKENSFYRWKVKAEVKLFKNAVDRFALYSKINMHTAFWRLRNMIKKPEPPKADKKSEKLYRALLLFAALFKKKEHKLKTIVMCLLHRFHYKGAQKLRALLVINKNLLRSKKLAFEKWASCLDMAYKLEEVKIMTKCLLRFPDLKAQAFQRWKANCLKSKVIDREVEKKMIQNGEHFGHFLIRIYERKLTAALEALRRNSSQVKHETSVKQKFLLGLLKTTFGKKALAFEKWKNMAKNERTHQKQVATDLENKLLGIRFRKLRWAFENLKSSFYESEEIKRKAIKKLLLMSRSKQKQMFDKWVHFTTILRHFETYKSTFAIATMIRSALINQITPIYASDSLQRKKIEIIRLLQERIRSRLTYAFFKWRNVNKQTQLESDLKLQKLNTPILAMIRLITDLEKKRLKQAFNDLLSHMKENNMKKRMLNGLLRTTFGLLQFAFNKWKSVPSKAQLEKNANVVKGEKILTGIYLRRLKYGFNPLKDIWYEIAEVKKRAIKHMLFITQDKSSKLFHRWASNVRNIKHMEYCRDLIHTFKIIENSFYNQIHLVLTPEENFKRRRDILMLLFDRIKSKKSHAFQVWKEKASKAQVLAEMNAQKRIKSSEKIALWLEKRVLNIYRQGMDLIRKRIYAQGLQKRFILALFKTKFGAIHQAFQKWKSLRPRFNLKKRTSTIRIGDFLDRILRNKKRFGFEALKDTWEEANQIKIRAIKRIYLATEDGQKRAFRIWKEYLLFTRHVQVSRETIIIFELLKNQLALNTRPILENGRQNQLKLTVLRRLIDNHRRLQIEALMLWKHAANKINYTEKIKDHQQEFGLFKANEMIENKIKNENLKEAFDALKKISNAKNVQKRMIIALLRSSSGKLYNALMKWKNWVHDQHATESKSSDVGRALEKLIIRKLKLAFDALKEEWYQAEEIKKKCLKVLLLRTESKLKISFDKWAATAKNISHIEACRGLFHMSEILQDALKNQTALIYTPERTAEKKRNALSKLRIAWKNLLAEAFKTWANAANALLLEDKVSDNQKLLGAKNIEEALNKKSNSNLKDAFNELKRNQKEYDVKKRFLLGLMKTTFGKLNYAFLLWKSLPPKGLREDQKNASAIENQLYLILRRRLHAGFEAIKSIWEEKEEIKAEAIRKILIGSVGKLRHTFEHWNHVAIIEKNIETCKAAVKFHEIMNNSLKINTALLFSTTNSQKKAAVIQRILLSLTNKLASAFKDWKNACEIGKLHGRIKAKELEVKHAKKAVASHKLGAKLDDHHEDRLKHGFEFLKRCCKEADLKKRAIRALFNTHIGLLYTAFLKWKGLPPKHAEVALPMTNLEKALHTILRRKLKSGFDPLKEKYEEKFEIKAEAMRKLIVATTGKLHTMFIHWSHVTINQRDIETCKNTIELFKIMKESLKNSSFLVYRTMAETKRKEALIRKLLIAYNSKRLDAFNRWRAFRKLEELKENANTEKAKSSVHNIKIPIDRLLKESLRSGFDALKNNKNEYKIKQRIIVKLFRNTHGQVYLAFMKWKAFPSKKELDRTGYASEIEKALHKLLLRKLSLGFKALKSELEEKNKIIESCLIKLINSTTGKTRNAFEHWMRVTNMQKDLETCKNVIASFNTIELALKQLTTPIYTPSRIQEKKANVIKHIFVHYKSKLAHAFDIWKHALNNHKIAELENAHLNEKTKVATAANLVPHLEHIYKNKLREAMYALKYNSKTIYVLKKAKNRILHTVFGQLFYAFNKWKNTPKANMGSITSASDIEKKLMKLIQMKLRYAFNEIKKIYEEKNEIKANAIRKMLIMTIGKQKYYFRQWSIVTNMIKDFENVKSALKFFEITLKAHQINTLPILQTGRITAAHKSAGALYAILNTMHRTRIYNAFHSLSRAAHEAHMRKTTEGHEAQKQHLMHSLSMQESKLKEMEEHKKNMADGGGFARKLMDIIKPRLRWAYEALKYHKNPYDPRKLLIANRILLKTQAKVQLAFELWKSQSTQIVIKKFYDIVLLEKALINYINFMRMKAFYRIRTTAIVDYKRTYINALWKWKLSNTEARYYTKQLAFTKRSQAATKLILSIDHIVRAQKYRAFNALASQTLKRGIKKDIYLSNASKIMKSKLMDYFNTLRGASYKKAQEEKKEQIVNALSSAHLNKLFDKFVFARRAEAFLALVKNTTKLRRLNKILTNFVRIFMKNKYYAFSKLKNQSLFVYHAKHNEAISNSLGKVLENYMENLYRKAFNMIYYKANLRYQQRINLEKAVTLLSKNHMFVMKQALIKMSIKKQRIMLENLYNIIKRLMFIQEKSGLDSIKSRRDQLLLRSRFIGIQKLLRMSKMFEQFMLYHNFHQWNKNAKNINPWFKKSLQILAKNSRVNVQIAYWRLRDGIQVAGCNLSAPKMIQCRKIFNFVKKQYEHTIAKAFWMMERVGNIDYSVVLPNQSKNRSAYQTQSPDQLPQNSGRLEQQIPFELVNKQRAIILKNAANHLASKFQGINSVKAAWDAWKLHTSAGKKVIVDKVDKSMREVEVNYIAKHGAADIIGQHINFAIKRLEKRAFDQIYRYAFMGDKKMLIEPLEIDDLDKERLVHQHQELLISYDKRSKELANAVEALNSMGNRLNFMISMKFMKTLDKYRILNLASGFSNIIQYSQIKKETKQYYL